MLSKPDLLPYNRAPPVLMWGAQLMPKETEISVPLTYAKDITLAPVVR